MNEGIAIILAFLYLVYNLARRYIESGYKVNCAVALILPFVLSRFPTLSWLIFADTLQGLNPCLLVYRKQFAIFGRVTIQLKNSIPFFPEVGVFTIQPSADTMGLEIRCSKPVRHRLNGNRTANKFIAH